MVDDAHFELPFSLDLYVLFVCSAHNTVAVLIGLTRAGRVPTNKFEALEDLPLVDFIRPDRPAQLLRRS